MTATSEAIALGERHGLDMATMIEVLNASSGRNSATGDKFPNRILPGTYDTGFTSRLLERICASNLEALGAAGGEAVLVSSIHEVWRRLEDAEPNGRHHPRLPLLKEGRWRAALPPERREPGRPTGLSGSRRYRKITGSAISYARNRAELRVRKARPVLAGTSSVQEATGREAAEAQVAVLRAQLRDLQQERISPGG